METVTRLLQLWPLRFAALILRPTPPSRRAQDRALAACPDHLLRDIGLRRCENRGAAPDRDAT